MKKLVVRTIFVLTLLLALGAIFGGTNATPAHAATLSKASSSHIFAATAPIVSYDITVPDCAGRIDFFKVYFNWGSSSLCFANAGSIKIGLAGAYEVCTGNNTGAVIWYDAAHNINVYTTFSSRYTCQWITSLNANTFVNVYEVVIN